jgi:hypothetical protein
MFRAGRRHSWTPLVARSTRSVKRLDKTPEPERPGKVIVAILPDGLENASQEFKRKEIFKMIQFF